MSKSDLFVLGQPVTTDNPVPTTTTPTGTQNAAITSPLGRRAATTAVSNALSQEDFDELKRSSNGTTVVVTSVATVATLKAANTARKAITVANDSTSILYILLGAGTVSATNYTFALSAKGTVAASLMISDYTGIITGIWASANGFATVTELT